jgi:hypothetical protein
MAKKAKKLGTGVPWDALAHTVKLYTEKIPADARWAAVVLINHEGDTAVYGGTGKSEPGVLLTELRKAEEAGFFPVGFGTDDQSEAERFYDVHLVRPGGPAKEAELRFMVKSLDLFERALVEAS